MGERYLVTGVQLGMLIALKEESERQHVVDQIIDKQYIGNTRQESSCVFCVHGLLFSMYCPDCERETRAEGGCMADYDEHDPKNKDCACVDCCKNEVQHG